MPNSLTAGPQLKKNRMGKFNELLANAIIHVRSGATVNVNSGGTFRITPVGTKPATCTVGDLCADAGDGNKLYQCTATNTWTKVGTQA
jgi:hypothetical protein